MLSQAISELKGQPAAKEIEVRIYVPVNAFIPHNYISDETARLETYRRIAALRSLEEASEVKAALTDIYGTVPPVVKNLIDICRLKILASDIGITDISWQLNKLAVSGRFSDSSLSLFRANNPDLKVVCRPHNLIVFPVDREGILSWLFKLLDDIIPPLINPKSSFLDQTERKGTAE
jgi:transcription-repair coupling factor (superfamily II helicase)